MAAAVSVRGPTSGASWRKSSRAMTPMSPRRSRSGGTWTTKHSSRWYRSRRNSPRLTRCSRRAWVAATTRTSASRPLPGPADAADLVPVERTQDLGLRLERQDRRSRRERAFLPRRRRTRLRGATCAPVNAPRSWPNSSLSTSSRGTRRHVDRDERARPPRPFGVKRAGEELLAGAALARDEDRQRRAARVGVPGRPCDAWQSTTPRSREGLARRVPRVAHRPRSRRRVSSAPWRRRCRLCPHASRMRAPPTNVPFRDPRSSMATSPPQHAERAVPRTDRRVVDDKVGGRRRPDDEPLGGQRARVALPPRPAPRRPRTSSSAVAGISTVDDDGEGSSTSGIGDSFFHDPLSGRRRQKLLTKRRLPSASSRPRFRASCAARSTARSPRRRAAPSSFPPAAGPRELRLGADDLLGDLQVGAEQQARPARRDRRSSCIQRFRSAFAPSSIHFCTTSLSDSRCTGCMCFTSSIAVALTACAISPGTAKSFMTILTPANRITLSSLRVGNRFLM